MLDGRSVTTKAGFLNLRDHKLVEDASAPAGSLFYDRAQARWLPTWRVAVSSDGRRYAYSEGSAFLATQGKLHVVDVVTGADRLIYDGGTVFTVLDFAADGIYLTPQAPEGRSRGLWIISPTGGAPRLINSSIEGPGVGGGAAWGLDFNAADPQPAPGGIEGPVNRVVHLDLGSGAIAHWFYRPGADLFLPASTLSIAGSPHSAVIVGARSTLSASSRETCPGRVTPGTRHRNGTRWNSRSGSSSSSTLARRVIAPVCQCSS